MNRTPETLARSLTTVLLMVITVSFVSTAQAEVRWWTHPKIAAALDLSQAQVEAIDQLAFTWEKQKIDLQSDVARARLELRRALDTQPLDESLTEAASDRLADAECALLRAKQKHRLEVAKELTLKQRRELQRLLEKFKRSLRRGAAQRLSEGGRAGRTNPPAS